MKSFCDKWESQIKALQTLEAESIRDPSQRDKIHREMAMSMFNDMWGRVKATCRHCAYTITVYPKSINGVACTMEEARVVHKAMWEGKA